MEILQIKDYGAYTYNREAGGKDVNITADFNDVMNGSGEAADKLQFQDTKFERKSDVLSTSSIDVITYNNNGKAYKINTNTGVNINIIA
ncbi:MAG: hypothetical protein JXB48_14670 [Candidatus Latescibacteria bacterium]|nr:hypothetical protein [Candidatus Latescibacterota bacterium]